ncbi:unnamed protein product [Adineta steineri]|uniref:MAM domain-containing protein n=1 Tax=Adineta steineri TaxID=433720 RepID=A0A820DC77_9BILA|nr:unnamed protein product [Adineta steineri]
MRFVIILFLGLFLIPPCKAQNEPSSTEASSTEGSSTETSSTEASSTEASSTEASSTEASSTEASSTEASSTEATTTQPPVTEASTAQPPVTEASTAQPPVTEASTAQPPVTEASTAQPPVTEVSTAQPPVTEVSTAQPTATEVSTAQPPATEVSTAQPPVTEISTAQPPATEVSTAQPPPTTTTERPFGPIFRCDFTTSCFGNDDLEVTDGSEFNPSELIATSQPPPAPVSDVTSTSKSHLFSHPTSMYIFPHITAKPTSNGQLCNLPYRPPLDDNSTTTNWDMWFCYNNQCPTTNGEATCRTDQYGLISLNASETLKTITDPLTPNVMARDASGDQCLRFYYYFTVYDGKDWGQQIQLRIIPKDSTKPSFSIGTITAIDMQQNKWQLKNITFKSEVSSYELEVNFTVTTENRTEDAGMNRTVYFALDNIELYNYNCSYVRDELEVTTTTTVLTTTTADPGTTPPEEPNNLPLILGLSLGIGIPVLLAIIGLGVYFYMKKKKSSGGYGDAIGIQLEVVDPFYDPFAVNPNEF